MGEEGGFYTPSDRSVATPFDWLQSQSVPLVNADMQLSETQIDVFWTAFVAAVDGAESPSTGYSYVLKTMDQGGRTLRVRARGPGLFVIIEYALETPTEATFGSVPPTALTASPDWPRSANYVLRPVAIWRGRAGQNEVEAWRDGETSRAWLRRVNNRLERSVTTALAAARAAAPPDAPS